MRTPAKNFISALIALLFAGTFVTCKKDPGKDKPTAQIQRSDGAIAKSVEKKSGDAPGLAQIQWPQDKVFETKDALVGFIEADPAWKALKLRYREVIDAVAEKSNAAGKYFDVGTWLPGSVGRWKRIKKYRANLVNRDTAVLDIGTGFGYFPLAGKYLFGIKSIEATDAPGVPWSDLYDDVTHVLGIRQYDLFVRKFEALGIDNGGRRYDLVTSWMMVFDYWNGKWGEKEWRFFLNDVRDTLLKDGGTIILGFNKRLDLEFMKWAAPLGAVYLGDKARGTVVVPWQALVRLKETQ